MKRREIEEIEGKLVSENGKISGTNLGYEHNQHGIMSFEVYIDSGDGGGYNFGGYTMDGHSKNYPDLDNREPCEFGLAVIMKILQVFKRDWENLTGLPIRLLKMEGWGGKVLAIGHYLEDDWVYVKDLVREFITKPETLENLREQHRIIGEKIEKLEIKLSKSKKPELDKLIESMEFEEEE